jgi:hypothetical protein
MDGDPAPIIQANRRPLRDVTGRAASRRAERQRRRSTGHRAFLAAAAPGFQPVRHGTGRTIVAGAQRTIDRVRPASPVA